MDDATKRWTLEGFVEHFDFVHHLMPDHKFVWILGAGASKASGIPLGSELVDRWLRELHLREGDGTIPLEQWATAERLGIGGFKYEARASFYTKIYHRRFRDYADEGFAYLERCMSGKDPSPGYSILAAALAGKSDNLPRHNAVVTTNFDNLVADALSIYTDVFPFVCGHESLTGFVRVAMRRPLICKIHRDLLLAPQNDPRSLRRLHDAWGAALRALFQSYTPLVIGYGGNDDTLMDLLESMQPGDIKGQLVWCYREGGQPAERIVNLVADLKGILVPVPDFDLLMVLLGEKMNIQLLDQEIGRRAEERTARYRERIQRLDTVKHPNVATALGATFDRSGGWWAWHRKAELERDLRRREIVYRQAIQHCPKDGRLHAVFADFLARPRGDHAEAERLYRKALELEPKDAFILVRFARFEAYVRRDHAEAERLFAKALEVEPNDSFAHSEFGEFLWIVRRKVDEAERHYRKAIELSPDSEYISYEFARFLRRALSAYDEAEQYYRRALALDASSVSAIVGLADLQAYTRGDYAEAERLYQRALELEPEDAYNTRMFAWFMAYVRRDYDESERLYQRALNLDPEDAYTIAEFAELLLGRGRGDKAEPLIRKALDVDPRSAALNLVMAVFLDKLRDDSENAERFYLLALELDSGDDDIHRAYAEFLAYKRGDHDKAEQFYCKAIELAPKDPEHAGRYTEWLLARGRFHDAAGMVEKVDPLIPNRGTSINAELSLYRSVLARVNGRDDVPCIEGFRKLLAEGFLREVVTWDPNPGLRLTLERLPPEDRALYSALIGAIRDPDNVTNVEGLLRERSAAIASTDGRHSGAVRHRRQHAENLRTVWCEKSWRGMGCPRRF